MNTVFSIEVSRLFPKPDPPIPEHELTRKVLVDEYLEILNEVYDTNVISPDESLEKVEALASITDPQLKGAAMACLGGVHTFTGNYVKAFSAFHEALDLVDQPDLRAVVYSEASVLLRKLGYEQEAIAILDQALALTRDDNLKRRLQTQKALCYKYTQSDRAIEMLTESLSQYEKVKDHRPMARVHRHLGSIYLHLDEFGTARKRFDQAMEIAVERDLASLQNEIINDKGWMLIREGKHDEARTVFDGLMKRDLSPYLKSLALQNIGLLEFERENLKEAIKFHTQSLRLTTWYEMREMAFEDYYRLGLCHEKLGEIGLADHFYRQGYLELQTEIDLGLRLTGYRKELLHAYVEFLNKHQKIPYVAMEDEVFGFAMDKSLKEIRKVFQNSLLILHLERTKNAPEMCRHLNIDTRTYFIYQKKLGLKRGRPRKGPFLDNPRLTQYVESLTPLSWKEANKKFEQDLFDYMMAKYQSNKTEIARALDVSYAQVVLKTK